MNTWRPCSACKKPILLGGKYYACSVSTCNRTRVPYVFCSVGCWDSHVPAMNHRDAWCTEQRAPLTAEPAVDAEPRRRIVSSPTTAAAPSSDDVLIVASRLKQYITDRADMNTAADVLEALSEIVRVHTDRAIDRARADGRKTVKGRDYT
jgi:hypothetical protein